MVGAGDAGGAAEVEGDRVAAEDEGDDAGVTGHPPGHRGGDGGAVVHGGAGSVVVLAEEVLEGEGDHDPVMAGGGMGLAFGPTAGLHEGFGETGFVVPLGVGDGLVGGVVAVVAAVELVVDAAQDPPDDGFGGAGRELAAELEHPVLVVPHAQGGLGLLAVPFGAAVVGGVGLDEPGEALLEVPRRLLGAEGEQVGFVVVERGAGLGVGAGSGMRHGVGVAVGDGAVLEGVLGLGQVPQRLGGVGPGLGLGPAGLLLAGQPVGVVLGGIRRVGGDVGAGAEPAGFAGGDPGAHRLGDLDHGVDLGAGGLVGVPSQEIDRTTSIEHQY